MANYDSRQESYKTIPAQYQTKARPIKGKIMSNESNHKETKRKRERDRQKKMKAKRRRGMQVMRLKQEALVCDGHTE
jgi:hypothetical protein